MASKENAHKDKFETLNRLLSQEYILLHINPAVDGTVLPSHLTKSINVTLKLSHYFRGGLDLKKDRIVTDLLFSGEYFTCHIPFEAVWGVTAVDGNNLFWQESAPEAIFKNIPFPSQSENKGEKPAARTRSGKIKRTASHLKRVK